jgi:hypothetical protein
MAAEASFIAQCPPPSLTAASALLFRGLEGWPLYRDLRAPGGRRCPRHGTLLKRGLGVRSPWSRSGSFDGLLRPGVARELPFKSHFKGEAKFFCSAPQSTTSAASSGANWVPELPLALTYLSHDIWRGSPVHIYPPPPLVINELKKTYSQLTAAPEFARGVPGPPPCCERQWQGTKNSQVQAGGGAL